MSACIRLITSFRPTLYYVGNAITRNTTLQKDCTMTMTTVSDSSAMSADSLIDALSGESTEVQAVALVENVSVAKEVPMTDEQIVATITSFDRLLSKKSPCLDTFIVQSGGVVDEDATLDNVAEYLRENSKAEQTKIALRGFVIDCVDALLENFGKANEGRMKLDTLSSTIAMPLVMRTGEAAFITAMKDYIEAVIVDCSETADAPSFRARYFYVAKGKGAGVCLVKYKPKKLD